MKTIKIQTIAFFAIQNQKCFDLINGLLASTSSEKDEHILKSNDVPAKVVNILKEDGYHIGFSNNTLKCFERNVLVSLSVEYRHARRLTLMGGKKEDFASWNNNRAKAGLGL
ncbi:TPA: hypothetical protein U1V77_001552 [Streptococcus suis]|nr:hypothetical protein [Streptococcus suis]HEM3178307.1 hypothetical protein [Streptococcus suis]HEM4030587.1 hypothetical protein [Streptococcus suis]